MKQTLKITLLVFFLATTCLADQSSPDGAVTDFYGWYQQAGFKYRDKFVEAEPYFTEEFYGLLKTGFKRSQGPDFWVDFDPFVNAQMEAQKISVGKPSSQGADLAMVPMTPTYGRGGASNYEGPVIKLYVKRAGEDWKIANIVYGGDHPFELKAFLEKGLGR